MNILFIVIYIYIYKRNEYIIYSNNKNLIYIYKYNKIAHIHIYKCTVFQ